MLAWYGRKLILGKLQGWNNLSTELVDNSVCIFKNGGKWALLDNCSKNEQN
jgi:hypothetical protein